MIKTSKNSFFITLFFLLFINGQGFSKDLTKTAMCEGMKNNDECLEFINNKDNIIYQGGEKVGYVDKIISKKGQYVTLNKMFYTKKYDDKKYFRYKDLILLYCLSPGPQFSTDMDIFHPGEFTSDGSYNGIFFHAKFKIIENYE